MATAHNRPDGAPPRRRRPLARRTDLFPGPSPSLWDETRPGAKQRRTRSVRLGRTSVVGSSPRFRRGRTPCHGFGSRYRPRHEHVVRPLVSTVRPGPRLGRVRPGRSRRERAVGNRTECGLLGRIERRRELLGRVEAGSEPADEFGLVLRAGEERDGSVLYGDQGLFRVGRGEPAAGTRDAASRPVFDERGPPVGREPANGGEPFEMGVTADYRDRHLFEKQERHRPAGGRVKCGLAGITLDLWGLLDIRGLSLGGVYRTHIWVIYH